MTPKAVSSVPGEKGAIHSLEALLRTAAGADERLFRTIIDVLPAAIYTTDAEGRITHFNPACVEFSGRTPEIGSDHWCVTWKLFHPDGTPMPHDECPMAVALKTGRAVRGVEAIAERPDGSRVWFEPYPTPLFDDAGKIIGGINMLVDITERKLAEARTVAELNESRILHSISTGLFDHDSVEVLYEKVVDAAVAIMGSDCASMQVVDERENGLRMVAFRGFGPEFGEIFGFNGPDTRTSCSVARRDGRRVVVTDVETCDFVVGTPALQLHRDTGIRAVQSTPLFSRCGTMVGMISTHWHHPHEPSERDLRLLDVLARQAADLIDRQHAEETIRRSEERYRNLFNAMDQGYCIIDVIFDERMKPIDYRFVEVNNAFETQSGMRDVVGRRMLEFVPDIEEHWLTNYGSVALTGEPVRFADEYKGLSRSFDVYAFRVGEPGLHRIAVLFADITQRKAAEEQLLQAKRQAETASAAKDRFLAMLSHELRTPLTPVMMSITAMDMDPSLPPAIRDNIALIRRSVDLEAKLIDDLLDLNLVTAGKLRLQMVAVDVSDAVRQVCQTCQTFILEKGIHLHCDLPDTDYHVRADAARLQQVLSNLIRNAAKFTPERGDIYVTVSKSGEQRVSVQIRDTGIGITPAALPRIFDAFEQGDPNITRQFGGMGLGLAISKALVEVHGGTIRAESDGTRGSTFTVELPTMLPRSDAPAAPASRDDGSGEEGGLRVLIVEDHVDTAHVMSALLRASGHQVKTTGSAAAALQLAATEPFDVMISDIGLPDATGYELMRQIQERYSTKGIALSGYGMDEDVRRSREAGFSDHLVKPVHFEMLERTLRRVAGKV